jgi:hypothetical protein
MDAALLLWITAAIYSAEALPPSGMRGISKRSVTLQ